MRALLLASLVCLASTSAVADAPEPQPEDEPYSKSMAWVERSDGKLVAALPWQSEVELAAMEKQEIASMEGGEEGSPRTVTFGRSAKVSDRFQRGQSFTVVTTKGVVRYKLAAFGMTVQAEIEPSPLFLRFRRSEPRLRGLLLLGDVKPAKGAKLRKLKAAGKATPEVTKAVDAWVRGYIAKDEILRQMIQRLEAGQAHVLLAKMPGPKGTKLVSFTAKSSEGPVVAWVSVSPDGHIERVVAPRGTFDRGWPKQTYAVDVEGRGYDSLIAEWPHEEGSWMSVETYDAKKGWQSKSIR